MRVRRGSTRLSRDVTCLESCSQQDKSLLHMQLVRHVTSLSFFILVTEEMQHDAHHMSHNHCLYITFYPFALSHWGQMDNAIVICLHIFQYLIILPLIILEGSGFTMRSFCSELQLCQYLAKSH